MPKVVANLTVKQVEALARGADGTWPISPRLYLQVKGGNASLCFRYRSPVTGKGRMMGLGPWLKDAYNARNVLDERRAKVAELVALVRDGADPLMEKKREAGRRPYESTVATFREVADDYIGAHAAEWTPHHLQHWESSLATYVHPMIGNLLVGSIRRDDVLKVLKQPIKGNDGEPGTLWTKYTVTAMRVRNRIELILGAAKSRGLRTGENPAQWKEGLDSLLAKPSKITHKKPHAALPYNNVPALVPTLQGRTKLRSRALEFLILTAARTSTVRLAQWGEIDKAITIWTVPASKMRKNDLPWRSPLSSRAVEILATIRPADAQPDDYVFPGRSATRPMAHDCLDVELKALAPEFTVHGMRSAFRTWAAEHGYNFQAAEFQLAHVEGSETVKAYQRSDLLELRRPIMAAWAMHCLSDSAPSNVVPLRASAGK